MILTLSIFIYLLIVFQCVFLPNAESFRNGTAIIQIEETAKTRDISICGTPQAIASICANLTRDEKNALAQSRCRPECSTDGNHHGHNVITRKCACRPMVEDEKGIWQPCNCKCDLKCPRFP